MKAPASQKVPFLSKLAFGSGDLGTAITAGVLGFFRLIFMTDVAGLNPALAGAVLLIGRVWDAVNGPNLEANIRPTRGRATVVLRKGPSHDIEWIRMRKA